MPTFQKANKDVAQLAADLIAQYDTHKPLAELKVKIDIVMAFADEDDRGNLLNDALTAHGVRALGITRKVGLKHRALGHGDAEIALDGNYWAQASAEEQAALLDHELHHISVQCDKNGNPQFDDLRRPKIVLRKHDVQVGWFKVIAERHGAASIERLQAKAIMDGQGQFYWPGIAPTMELITNGKSTGPMPMDTLTKAGAVLAKKGGRK